MSSETFEVVSARNLGRLLPGIDQADLLSMIRQASGLAGPAAASEYFMGLLGQQDAALRFITDFCAKRWTTGKSSPSPSSDSGQANVKVKRASVTPAATIRSKNFGATVSRPGSSTSATASNSSNDQARIGMGYMKKSTEESYYVGKKATVTFDPSSSSQALPSAGNAGGTSTQSPRPTTTTTTTTAIPPFSAGHANSSVKGKIKDHHAGTLISDRAKTKQPKPKPKPKSSVALEISSDVAVSRKFKVNSLREVENALIALELEYNNRGSDRNCNCQAQRHPLYELAPNCMHCGKIICTKQGAGPCTFCGKPLLTPDEYDAIVAELRQERGHLRSDINNDAARKHHAVANRTTYSGTVGATDSFVNPTAAAASSSSTSDLDRAHAQLSNLLNFQATSAQRTKIIDHASDFETPIHGTDRWASTEQRALQLKKQQRTAKQMDRLDRKRNGRGKRVVSINLTGQKVVVADHSETDYSDDDDEDEDEDDEDVAVVDGGTRRSASDEVEKSISWNPKRDKALFIKPHYPTFGVIGQERDKPQQESTIEASDHGVAKFSRIQDANLLYGIEE
ncbi:hypothetical protein V1514DRAFT_301739 [Lipomyces japonicus]|uniref:uncharacterized protein n=1 Tax=Lipomyces japonicus TaxID=56871 RepID=UPI0034CD9A26